MSLEGFEYILAVAEERNLTRAAKRLFISQPSLTQYSNRLEAELGVRLFNRNSTPITLTPAGGAGGYVLHQSAEEFHVVEGFVLIKAALQREGGQGAGALLIDAALREAADKAPLRGHTAHAAAVEETGGIHSTGVARIGKDRKMQSARREQRVPSGQIF